MEKQTNEPKIVAGRRALLPISVKEIKALGINTGELPKGTDYVGIYASPSFVARGFGQWVKAGCQNPFQYSESYMQLYLSCSKLKDSHQEMATNWAKACGELKETKQGKEKAEADRVKAENDLRIKEYATRALEDQLATSQLQVKKYEVKVMNLEGEIKGGKVTLAALDKSYDGLAKTNDATAKGLGQLDRRLNGNWYRRLITKIFRI